MGVGGQFQPSGIEESLLTETIKSPRAGLKGEGFRPAQGLKVGVKGGCLPPGKKETIDSPTPGR